MYSSILRHCAPGMVNDHVSPFFFCTLPYLTNITSWVSCDAKNIQNIKESKGWDIYFHKIMKNMYTIKECIHKQIEWLLIGSLFHGGKKLIFVIKFCNRLTPIKNVSLNLNCCWKTSNLPGIKEALLQGFQFYLHLYILLIKATSPVDSTSLCPILSW